MLCSLRSVNLKQPHHPIVAAAIRFIEFYIGSHQSDGAGRIAYVLLHLHCGCGLQSTGYRPSLYAMSVRRRRSSSTIETG